MPPRITFTPPLFNSATPWATTIEDLTALYTSPHTGAVTTRTSLLDGFPHNPSIHQHTLFPICDNGPTISLNTFGYSPHPLSYYLHAASTIIKSSPSPQSKPFIISITGSPQDIKTAVCTITSFSKRESVTLFIELNLSCPNIAGRPPPAYNLQELLQYLAVLDGLETEAPVTLGVKTPPYTHDAEYAVLLEALRTYPGVVAFVTATNTLGSCLQLSSPPSLTMEEEEGKRRVYQPTLSNEAGTGVGGLGGAAIHWLSLGNVATIRRLLNKEEGLRDVVVVGVGGVGDREGWERMLSVGAGAVGVGTALGVGGVDVFGRILE